MARSLYHLTVAFALVCFGVWMLVASYEQRPAAAVWIGGVSHPAIVLFLPRAEMAGNSHEQA